MAKVLIVGCGKLGLALGNRLTDLGHQVTGIKRQPPENSKPSFNLLAADITSARDLRALDDDFEYLFFIVSPGERTEMAYRRVYGTGLNLLLDRFERNDHPPQWLLVSSTSVYGQSQGEWVDENSPAEPENICSQFIREAELKLMSQPQNHTIVRFSGIYGPGREYLIRTAKQAPVIQQEPPYYTNRIHQQDCVAALEFLLEKRLAGVNLDACYLLSDNDPAPMWEVMTWLAQQMQVFGPVAKSVDTTSSMNKRCNNAKIKKLGYKFHYPSYREGYLDLIKS